MSFADKLKEMNLHTLLVNNRFFKIKPRNYECLEALVKRIISEQLRVYIDPDCDPDGLFCGKIVKTMFDRLGYSNYVVAKHFFKRHVLTVEYAQSLIEEKYDVVFLLDSSTNSLEVIKLLTDNGITVMVIDHHEPDCRIKDYPENAFLINPCMEVAEPSLSYPELQGVIQEWASKNYAICVKESKWMTPSITREALLNVFRSINYLNFKISSEVDERCDCVLVLDDRDAYRTQYKDVVVLATSKDFSEGRGARVLYPESALNTTAVLYKELSCGALCSLVCDYVLTKMGYKDNIDLYIMGYVTLYSDVCDLNNAYNVAYLRQYRDDKLNIPDTVQLFMSKYDYLNRSFVSYKLVPRINALIRTEHFDLVYKIFFNPPTEPADLITTTEEIDSIYQGSKQYAQELLNTCSVQDVWEKVIVGILPEDTPVIARNYTGLVASQLASKANALAFCLYKKTEGDYGGSARDPFGRNARELLKDVCYAQGHMSAFGIEIPVNQLSMVCSIVDNYFEEGRQEMLFVEWNDEMPIDKIKADILIMSEYGEYGGQGLPSAYAFFTVTDGCRIYKEARRTLVYWRGLRFVVFSTVLQVGDVLAVQPTVKGPDVELLVKNIGYLT